MDKSKNRYGRFRLSHEIIKTHNIDDVLKIFSDILIVRAESHYATNNIEYLGISKYFDEVGMGYEVPFYRLEIVHDGDGKIKFFFTRSVENG